MERSSCSATSGFSSLCSREFQRKTDFFAIFQEKNRYVAVQGWKTEEWIEMPVSARGQPTLVPAASRRCICSSFVAADAFRDALNTGDAIRLQNISVAEGQHTKRQAIHCSGSQSTGSELAHRASSNVRRAANDPLRRLSSSIHLLVSCQASTVLSLVRAPQLDSYSWRRVLSPSSSPARLRSTTQRRK